MANFEFDPRLRDDVLPQLEGQDDRVVAIVFVAIVEDQLRTAVKSHVTDNAKVIKRMFGGLGPLTSFSALIDMGQLLALYRDDFAEILHALRTVRNRFAHEPLVSAFDAPEFNAEMNVLAFMERYEPPERTLTSRERFIGAGKFMLGAFAMIISDAARPTVPEKRLPVRH